MAEVIHEGVAPDDVRHDLPASHGSLLIQMPQGVAHHIIEKPGVKIAAYDEVAVRSYPAEVCNDSVKVVGPRQFLLDEAEYDGVLRGLIGVHDVRLLAILHAEAIPQQVAMNLLLEARLSSSWEAGVLSWEHLRIEERVEHELRGVSYELVHDTQERNVAHLAGHPVRSRSYENGVNVLRILAGDDLSEYLVECQGARGNRFSPGGTFAGQLLDLNLGPGDPGILFYKREDVAAPQLTTEALLDGLLA